MSDIGNIISRPAKKGSQDDKALLEMLGMTDEAAEVAAGIAKQRPAWKIPEDGTRVFARFVSNDLNEITIEDETPPRKTLTTLVEDDSGVQFTLWMNKGDPKTKKIPSVTKAYYMVRVQANGDLTGKRCAFWKEPYIHKQFGPTMGTRMQLVDEKLEDKKGGS